MRLAARRLVAGRRLVQMLAICLAVGLAGLATADQTSPRLPALFDALKAADSAIAANALEADIWREWHRPPDADSSALFNEILMLMEAGEIQAAPAVCDKLVSRYPDFAEGWNKRATIHYLLGNHDASVADIQRTLALEPRHFGAISGLGLIFLQRGDEAAALKAYEQVLAISPLSRNAHETAKQLRERLGEGI